MDDENTISAPAAGRLKLLRDPRSGHCHRVELFMHILGLDCTLVDIDVVTGEAKSDAFRRLNPLMEVPVLWHGKVLIVDSCAMIMYLGLTFDDGTWLPRDPLRMSRIQRWLSIASGELLNGPVGARRIKMFSLHLDPVRAHTETMKLFRFMDDHLADNDYLIGRDPTVADITLYSYVSHAAEGGVDLAPFGSIGRWLAQIEAWPRFIPMTRGPTSSPLGQQDVADFIERLSDENPWRTETKR